jgi:serine/threonine-protein kinase
MRPIEGTTLGELLRRLRDDQVGARQEWSNGRLIRLFLQAANAVAFAHSREVIHRDLKPENIMVGPFEEVLVLDWGMAKVLGTESVQSTMGVSPPAALVGLSANTGGATAVGTPAYMAPEQFAGQPAGVKTDVFSLGVILYELLALRTPWPATTISELRRAFATPPDSPNRSRPGRGIPPELSRVALRALENDPTARFGSVGEFSKAVAGALEGRAPWRIGALNRLAQTGSYGVSHTGSWTSRVRL